MEAYFIDVSHYIQLDTKDFIFSSMRFRFLKRMYNYGMSFWWGKRADKVDESVCVVEVTDTEVNLFHSAAFRRVIYHSTRPLQTLPVSSPPVTLVMPSKSKTITPLFVRKARKISKTAKTSTSKKTSSPPVPKRDEIPWSSNSLLLDKEQDEPPTSACSVSTMETTHDASMLVHRIEEDDSNRPVEIQSASRDMGSEPELQFIPVYVSAIIDDLNSIYDRLSTEDIHLAFVDKTRKEVHSLNQVTWLPFFTPQDEAAVFTELRLHSVNLQIAIFSYMQSSFEKDGKSSASKYVAYEDILQMCEKMCVLHGSNEVEPEIEELSDTEVPWQSDQRRKATKLSGH